MKTTLLGRALIAACRLPLIGGLVQRALVSARFDSAFQAWGERSWLFQSLQDAWFEIDAMTRQELQRISDSLTENSSLVQKIRSLKIQFSAGPSGLKIVPDSSDDGYNDARSKNWEAWWSKPEFGGDISGAQLTRVWGGLLFDKGEVIVNLTTDEVIGPGGRIRKEPRIQTIDAHRLKTPAGMTVDDKTGWPIIDGKVINPKTGAVAAFWIKRANYSVPIYGSVNQTGDQFDRLDAANVIHKFHVRRPGQMRGIPCGASAFNLVRDFMDLQKLEMQVAKQCAAIGTVETNPSGELDTYTNRKQKLNIQTQNSAGSPVNKNFNQNWNVSLGAQKIALPTGSKISDFQINRPTVVQQQYWDLLTALICVGYETPKLLVMPFSLQGTVTRADLDVCASAFRADFELLREICERVYAWHSQWTLDRDTTFKAPTAPDDAHVCLIRPPRAPNVDIGYTAKALEIEMRLGIKVPQDVFADQGKDWRTQTRQMAEYLTYVKKLEKEFKLDPGQITSLTTPQPIQDPTSRPDAPEGAPSETSPENSYA